MSRKPTARLRVETLEDRITPAAGDLDTTFGTDGTGRAFYAFDEDGYGGFFAADAAVQADGRVVVVGTVYNSLNTAHVGVIRLNADGKSLDPTFSGNGMLHFQPDAEYLAGSSVAIDAQQRVVIATANFSSGIDLIGPSIIRLTASGQFDTTFNPAGTTPGIFTPGLFLNSTGQFVDVVVRGDGNYLISVMSTILQVTPGGTLDPSFGSEGVADLGFYSSLRTQLGVGSLTAGGPEAGIWFGGTEDVYGPGPYGPATYLGTAVRLSRLTTTGQIDTGFGTNGSVTFEVPVGTPQANQASQFGGLAVGADGSAVVVGTSIGGVNGSNDFVQNMFVARFTPGGQFDPSFQGDGTGMVSLGQGQRLEARAVDLDRLGRIVVVAASTSFLTVNLPNFAVLRFRAADGALDPDFAVEGLRHIAFIIPGTNLAATFSLPILVDFQRHTGTESIIIAGRGIAGPVEAVFVRLESDPAIPPPKARDDAVTVVRSDGTATFDVLANDSNVDSDFDPEPFSIVSMTQPTYGTATATSYTLDPAYRNDPTVTADSFTYTIRDALGGTSTATVRLIIDNPPVGVADEYAVPHGTAGGFAVTDPAEGVLGNDTDPDAGPLTAVLAVSPDNGTVVLNLDGTFAYTTSHPSGLVVGDEFTYILSNGVWPRSGARVRIVSPNGSPTATGQTFAPGHGATEPLTGILQFSDPDADPLNLILTDGVDRGTLILNGGNPLTGLPPGDITFTYTPNGGRFVGGDAFTFRVTDIYGMVATATIRIDVPNAAPVATGGIIAGDHGASAPFELSGLTATDADGDPLTWTIVDAPDYGTVLPPVAGGRTQFTYTPRFDPRRLVGSDRFTYRVSDGVADSAVVAVEISVPNHAPTPLPDTFYFSSASSTSQGGLNGYSAELLLGSLSYDFNVLNNTVNESSYNGTGVRPAFPDEIPFQNVLVSDRGAEPSYDDFDRDGDRITAYLPLNGFVNNVYKTRYGSIDFLRPDGSFRYTNATGFRFPYVAGMPIPLPEQVFERPSLGYELTAEELEFLVRFQGLPQSVADLLTPLVGQKYDRRADFDFDLGPRFDVGGDLSDYYGRISNQAYGRILRDFVLGEDGEYYDLRGLYTLPIGVDYFTYAVTDGYAIREARVTLVFGAHENPFLYSDARFPSDDAQSASSEVIWVVGAGERVSIPRSLDGMFSGLLDDFREDRTVTVTGQPEHGRSTVEGLYLIYEPVANYDGLDRIRYYIRQDDKPQFADAQFADAYFLVQSRDVVPQPDAFGVANHTTLTVPDIGGVLRNDGFVDGPALRIDRVTAPTLGRIVSWSPGGGFVYQPNPGARGVDTFQYRVLDEHGGSALGTITINVYDRAVDGDYGYVTTPDGYHVGLQTAPGTTLTNFSTVTAPGAPRGVSFPLGRFSFQIAGLTPGGTTTATILLPPDAPAINSYWKYGPSLLFPAPRWYPFTPSIETGARFSPGRIDLTFRDGRRGDTDGVADGVITDPGGPAFADPAFLSTESGALLVGHPVFAAEAGAGGGAVVTVYNADGSVRSAQVVFDGDAPGGVRATVGDFDRDSVADVAVGTGLGVPARVRVLSGATGAELFAADVFEGFTGGVFVAAGDLNGDGRAELVVTPDAGGGPRVLVFRGGDFALVENFFAFDDPAFRGGARPAIGDIDGDGRGELVVAAGTGGGPRVAVFRGDSVGEPGDPVRLMSDFFAFDANLRDGAFVAVGDVDGDGLGDIITGAGDGGAPHVRAFGGRFLLADIGSAVAVSVASFYAGNPADRSGVRVAVADLDGDRRADLVTTDGGGAGSRVAAYYGTTFASGSAPEAFGVDVLPGFTGGVFIG